MTIDITHKPIRFEIVPQAKFNVYGFEADTTTGILYGRCKSQALAEKKLDKLEEKYKVGKHAPMRELTNKELSNKIKAFLTVYGKRAAMYDQCDEPEWNSPDAAELEMDAKLIELGLPVPRYPWSDWGSGGYSPYTSITGRVDHDNIVKLIEAYRTK